MSRTLVEQTATEVFTIRKPCLPRGELGSDEITMALCLSTHIAVVNLLGTEGYLCALGRRMLTHFGSLDWLGRERESYTHSLLQQNWFPFIRQGVMHYWAVPVSLKMFFKTLCWAAPGDGAHLLAGHFPIGETFESLKAELCMLDGDKIDECIT